MAITINGSGTITGISAGGLPDGSVTAADLADTYLTGVTSSDLPSGSILQVVHGRKTDIWSGGNNAWATVTGLNATITPSSTSSKIIVILDAYIGATGMPNVVTGQITRNGTDCYVGDSQSGHIPAAFSTRDKHDYNVASAVTKTFVDEPSTTSAVTYALQLKCESGESATVNRTGSNLSPYMWSVRTPSSFTLMEIAG